jgi:hypothetical protein
VTVTVTPALAASAGYLDFESTGSQSEIASQGKGEVVKDLKATMVRVSAFSFGSGRDGVVPKGESIDSATGGAGAGKLTIGSQTSGAGAGKIASTGASLDVTVAPEGADKIFTLALGGKPIPNVRLIIYKDDVKDGGKIPVYSALMRNVRVVSADWTGSKTDKATTRVTLDYMSIELQKNTNADSPTPTAIIGGWNRISNTSDISTSIIN